MLDLEYSQQWKYASQQSSLEIYDMACDMSDLKYCYWTIYLKRSYKTFTISACNKDAVFSAKGAYRYLRNVDFAMTLV
jgi:hypothetical protein